MTQMKYRPTDLSRHPAQVFLISLCLLTSLPTLLGQVPAPSSINAVLPHWMRIAWSAYLCVGSLIVLIGMFWSKRVTGMIVEQSGLVAVAGGSFLYALAILITVGFARGGGITVGLLLGFTATLVFRWYQIHGDINELTEAKKLQEEG